MLSTHPRDYSPDGWTIRDTVESLEREPKRWEGIAYLTLDQPYAHVPCGRYGSNSVECAPVAWRLAYLIAREQGEPITFDDLDWAMGLVVNSHDDVSSIINQYGHGNYGRR